MYKLSSNIKNLLGIDLNEAQIHAFEWYEKELLTWNERFNLTAIRDAESIRTKHFLDSLSCALLMNGQNRVSLIDIGTGAGFPGIPLKIMFPQIQLTLVESIGKKAEFCRHVVKNLKLDGTRVLQERAEDIGQHKKHREKYDWAVARAVANLNTLAEYLLPLLRVGGVMIAQKGSSGPFEAHTATAALQMLGGHLRIVRELQLPGIAEERYIIAVDKIAATPQQYPRRVGKKKKKPLE